jgi:nucleoside-diphosphate-sugar epimerase
MANPLARDLEHVLDHTGEVWAQLSGARIFLTGGTGFFGCWLLESFTWAVDRLGLDASITVLTRAPRAFREKAPHLAGHRAVELVSGDIRTFAFPEGGYSHVIHGATAASAALNQNEPLEMLDTIVEGTRRTLDFAEACGARRFLLTSSGAVYGPQPVGMMRMGENYGGGPNPLDPRSAYAEGKRLAEWLGCEYARRSGMDFLVARGFAFTGAYLPLDIHFAIGNFIRDALGGGRIEIRGDGTPYRSYLYAADLAIWLWTILERGESCRPYNVGSERAVSIAELAVRVAEAAAPGTAIRIAGKPQPGAAPNRYVPDTSRAREELGLEEWIPLEEAIRRTAAAVECTAGVRS